PPSAGLDLDGAGDAVRGEDHRGAVGHLVQFLDEARTEAAQAVHHVAVVHHLVAYIDRCAEQLQRPLDDVDGTVHACAEAPWTGQQDPHPAAHGTLPLATCRSRRHWRSASSRMQPAPTVMQLSATLKAGK